MTTSQRAGADCTLMVAMEPAWFHGDRAELERHVTGKGAPSRFRIRHLHAADTYSLRGSVLRSGRVKEVRIDGDDDPRALHIGAVDETGALVGTSSYYVRPMPGETEGNAVQLRMMAVAPSVQGHGVGGAILEEAISELAARGDRLIWANARDSALAFYLAHGFEIVEGSQFVHDETGLPHTVVKRRIEPR